MPETDKKFNSYSDAQLSKYRHLIRQAVRWLFSGDVTERINAAQPDDGQASGLPKKRKASKISEKDLAVVIIDALSYYVGWVSEETFSKEIQLGGKQVRRMLQFLEKQGFVVREHRRERKQGTKVESVAEHAQLVAEARTATYVCIDYPHFFDMIRLRMYLAKLQATDGIDDGSVRSYICNFRREHQVKAMLQAVESYICCSRDGVEPVCGKKYTSFDMLYLDMSKDGFYMCGTCDVGIVAPDDGPSQSEPNGVTRINRARIRRKTATEKRQALLKAVKPLDDLISTLQNVDPPDFGSFTDWSSRRQEMLKAGKATAKQASGKSRNAGYLDYGIDGPLTGDVGVNIQLVASAEDQQQGAAVSAVAQKDPKASLPYFIKQGQADPAGTFGQGKVAAKPTETEAQEEAEKQRLYLEEFRKQYEAQIRALSAIPSSEKPPVKTENDAVKPEPVAVDEKATVIKGEGTTVENEVEDDMEWEDAGDDAEWEDV